MPRYIRAGKYNKEHETELPVIIGGGTSKSNRKDIMTMDWDGNVKFAGGIETAGGSLDEDGNLSIDGNAEIDGDVEISGETEITSGSLVVSDRNSQYSYKTEISDTHVSTRHVSAESVYANNRRLFTPYRHDFSIFFDSSYVNRIYFSTLSEENYPKNATANAEFVECLRTFLFVLGYDADQHLNTGALIGGNSSKIFAVNGTINGCPVLGIYAYTGSDDPRYQIDIICKDSSETSGYKVYTWVDNPIVPAPEGETRIQPFDWYMNHYYIGNARFE